MRNGKLIGINELRINWKRGEECVGEKKQGKAKKKKMENNWKSEKNVGESTALKKIKGALQRKRERWAFPNLWRGIIV